jgi:hypothetical protein
MFRFLIRSGVVALFVLSLSAPAQALPLGEVGSFEVSLSEIWERLTAQAVSLWTGCDPDTGCTSGGTGGGTNTDGRGGCDPNGGICGS